MRSYLTARSTVTEDPWHWLETGAVRTRRSRGDAPRNGAWSLRLASRAGAQALADAKEAGGGAARGASQPWGSRGRAPGRLMGGASDGLVTKLLGSGQLRVDLGATRAAEPRAEVARLARQGRKALAELSADVARLAAQQRCAEELAEELKRRL